MAWNDMTREQMEAQLLRQAQTIGVMREALEHIAKTWPDDFSAGHARVAIAKARENQGHS